MSEGKFKEQGDRQLAEATLELMGAIEEGCDVSQRSLAQRMGVALGLTNALIKRSVKKGLLKVKEAPARRFAYYMTPKGFQEKTRLTAEYLTTSLDFFRTARGQYAEAITYCVNRGWTRIAFYGASELAEIAVLAAHEVELHPVAIVAPGRNIAAVGGCPVVGSLKDLEDVDAVIITDAQAPQSIFEALSKAISYERIVTPDLLHVSRGPSGIEGGEEAT
ncbi:MAG: MarR family winged helix-turn-helix transcriptional regulator [Rhodospirillales bacterium]|nr:MarR family winged helix-turn-helix transcriptional regulator [Rhodospirillales bacterium]